MRLSRLDLTRYGHFTDGRIDFGPAEPGRPDLHVVYGPNESGKTTALAAILDVLFGIETRSRYDFLHPYASMAIGAAVESGGESRELVRVKRNQNSLLDRAGQPADEGALAAALSNLDREAFREMFSMDDDTLEAGGEGILASKGDLGQLLFSASAGLAELSEKLAKARSEADAFLKAKSRTGELATLKARLAELKRQKDELDTLAGRHGQLVAARNAALRGYDEAISARGSSQARSEALRRQLGALPRLGTLRALREQRDGLAGIPEAPAAWAGDLAGLLRQEVEVATRLEGKEAALALLEAEVAGIAIDRAALACGDRVDRLAELRPRHVTAEKDLPERRIQLRAAELAIAGSLRRLGREDEADPARLLLDASTSGALRELTERRSGVDEGLRGARSEVAAAERLVTEARATLERVAGQVRGGDDMRRLEVERLDAALAAAQGGDAGPRMRLAERARASLAPELADKLSTLGPWQGDADDLARLAVPEAAEVERWRADLADADGRAGRADDDLEKAQAEGRRHQAELDAAAAVAGLVPEQDAGRVRTDREQAWAVHRDALDRPSADAFEAVLRKDDALTAARIGHEKDLVRLRTAHEAVAVAASTARAAAAARDAALAKAAGTRAAVAEAAGAMGAALHGMALPRLEAWLGRRASALELRDRLRSCERDLREAVAEAAGSRSRLAGALAAAGVPHGEAADLDALVLAARHAMAREGELAALNEGLADRERDMARRGHELEQAAAAERGWHEAWRSACSRCWLGEGGAGRTTSEVRGLMDALAELGPALDGRAGLVDRIGKMEADQAAFARAAAGIAADMPTVDGAGQAADVARRLDDAVRAARADRARLEARSGDLGLAKAERERLAEAVALHARRAAEMTAHFGVASLAEVGGKLRELERRADLTRQAEVAEREIAAGLGTQTIAEAEVLLDGLDRQRLEAELAETRMRFEDQDQRTRDSFAALGRTNEQLEAIGGDEGVARIAEARRTTLLEVTDKGVRYLRLRTGIAAAEQALRIYRERHRSSMMGAASDAFRILSRGRYSLASRPEREGETLIAVNAAGGSRTVRELSKGTRFQLYLALRVAGFREFARSRPALPFVADDILETFDDLRAEEAFRALAGMAEVGQVVYLTHHPHLCRIAALVCPTVKIHELEPLPAET